MGAHQFVSVIYVWKNDLKDTQEDALQMQASLGCWEDNNIISKLFHNRLQKGELQLSGCFLFKSIEEITSIHQSHGVMAVETNGLIVQFLDRTCKGMIQNDEMTTRWDTSYSRRGQR